MPESDEAMPESDEAMPESDEAMPESDEAMPESDEAMPESGEAIPESDEPVPESDIKKKDAKIAAVLDPNEYLRLRKRPIELETAIKLLKAEMAKEAKQIRGNSDVSDSTDTAAACLNSINLSSSNEKQNSIDSLFSLCGIEQSPVVTQTTSKAWSIDEEIGYYISSINADQHIKFSSFWSTHEKRLPLMSALVRRISIIPASSVENASYSAMLNIPEPVPLTEPIPSNSRNSVYQFNTIPEFPESLP
ncbi:unnamed protein product, partial [Rotaria magnacalcarata]